MSDRPANLMGDREAASRYVVGIDLGTTNSALAYVDTEREPRQIAVLPIPQLVAPSQVEARETLPSFHYQATDAEVKEGSLKLPWGAAAPSYSVGMHARDEGARRPGRLIASAKSWLCHAGVDRTAELLPWQGDGDVERLSPIEVTSRYLQHLVAAWEEKFPQHPLAEQEVVVTLPASFDEVARELTIKAAKQAGLVRVMLIEEPQAAFYAWVDRHRDDWQRQVSAGQKILVCDIGGGTTDFTLIRVQRRGESDDVQFHRVAVGEHLILGGDNIDLALARYVEQKLSAEQPLSPQQWDVLVRVARQAKETLLGPNAPQSYTINLPSAGAKLIGGSMQVELDGDEVRQHLLEGFLPQVALEEKPQRRQSGFQDFGLPYAADPAITRYLAAFLTAHRTTGDDLLGDTASAAAGQGDRACPDIILFNGGFFASSLLQERLLAVLAAWFPGEAAHGAGPPRVLDHERLDLAVARGAAYYGLVRRGEGVRIAATLARSYYIGVELAEGEQARAVAVCLVPGNAAAGEDFEIAERTFQLALSEPVEFPLYVSSTRLADPPGAIVEIDRDELTPLPPIRTVLHTGKKREAGLATVRLHAHLNEIGALELSCREVDSPRSWRLQFDIRSTTQTDVVAHATADDEQGIVDEGQLDACYQLLHSVFGQQAEQKPSTVMKGLAGALDSPKQEWPTSVCRRLVEMLMQLESGRRRSPAHEARWLNLTGFAMRPGYGFAVDDWRVAEIWRAVSGKLVFPASLAESLILWRRLAGGLNRGQQLGLAEPLLAAVRGLHRQMRGGKAATKGIMDPAQSPELWRLLGSLELLPVPVKVELGEIITELLPKQKLEKLRVPLLWTLGRLGQRMPLYGPLNTLVSPAVAERWLEAVLLYGVANATSQLVVMQLARRTTDRHRDLPEATRDQAISALQKADAAEHLVALVRDVGQLDEQEKGLVFGESLPRGLRMGS